VSDDNVKPEFWVRSTVALALALYAWSMMGVMLYLRLADPADGPSRALAEFRRLIMGRGVIALGAAAVLAALILGLTARRRKRVGYVAVALGVAWVTVLLVFFWPL
jgi:hypothetical protein